MYENKNGRNDVQFSNSFARVFIPVQGGYDLAATPPEMSLSGSFGNVNIVAFIYPARQKEPAEHQCRDQENDDTN